jgi:hypothetical protein
MGRRSSSPVAVPDGGSPGLDPRSRRARAALGGLVGAFGAVASIALLLFPPIHPGTSGSGDAAPSQPTSTVDSTVMLVEPPPTSAFASFPSSSPLPSSPSSASSSPAAGSGRADVPPVARKALSAMTPVTGRRLVSRRGHDVVVRCPTNRSGDRARVVVYALRAGWDRLDATVVPVRARGSRASAGVQVLVEVRSPGAERVRTGKAVARGGRPAKLVASVQGARQVSLVVTCAGAVSGVRIAGPSLVRLP